jgi:hypothetical protein
MNYIYYNNSGDVEFVSIFKMESELNLLEFEGSVQFYKPKVIEGELFEGATDEEIAEIQSLSVPQELTRSQLRQALLIKGIDEDDIVTAINGITNELHRKIMLIKWQDQQTYRRNNEDLKSIGQALGLTDKQINDIFILGFTL